MSETMSGGQIIGKLIGFTNRWNPLKTDIFAKVEVDKKVISIPIDYRQRKFIEMEHPINSRIPLVFLEGKWQIVSSLISADSYILNDRLSVF
jgi:hypothetical protein